MGTYNFHGDITGPGNYGDNGTINIGQQDTAAQTLRLAAELAQWLRSAGADQAQLDAAQTLHGELDRAGREQRAAEPGVVRRALETITLGLGAGSTGLALAQELTRLLG
ncbi:hypothetical protein [Streptomyces sp. NBC_00503]|uniref:hypothetical protein n=1 Tax=Streptomyces sp. NBC_00503 TaxID=2903659 RepID=UPI002E823A33|nr:hypothetical protein [Streptomyces sp. NBC_00503]WUD84250.1 hypothetical protein OG490_28890 [Streptomyces sp. NBC_00503]